MLIILIPVFILTYVGFNLWRARQKPPPGPIPLPLLGNLLQIAHHVKKAGGLVEGLREFQKQYGNVFTLWIGPIPSVHIADYDIAFETHVKKANVFGHRYSNGGMNYLREGRGIIASNGEFWMEHRKFALTTLRNFGLGRNIMEQKIMDEYRQRLEDFKKSHWNNGGIEINANTFFDYMVGSIINQLLVSERFKYGDEDFEKLKNYLSNNKEACSITEAFIPLWVLKSDWMKWKTRKSLALFDYIFILVKKTIQMRQVVSAIKSGDHTMSEEGEDFVDAFLIKMEEDKKDGIDSTFDLETLAVDLYDLWIAGQETTSTTLTWACACLLNHPEVVENLRKELVEVTGRNRSVSQTDRANLYYYYHTNSEVQRIASILNFNLVPVLKEDTAIDGSPITAGTVFTTQLSLIHTDEKLFKTHTEFRPERFLKNNSLEKKLIPFGIGKRTCLGESLARAELYLIMGNLVLEYDLKTVGDKPEIKSTTTFAVMKRPPCYDIRFVPVSSS